MRYFMKKTIRELIDSDFWSDHVLLEKLSFETMRMTNSFVLKKPHSK